MKPTFSEGDPRGKYAWGNLQQLTKVRRIIWHCTATPEGRNVSFDDLWLWHVAGNNYSGVGYHYLIDLQGTVIPCRPLEFRGAGVAGHNHDSIHIAYAGGCGRDGRTPKDTRTPTQTKEMDNLTRVLAKRYGLTADDIHGHNEYAAKACPSFDVRDYLKKVALSFEEDLAEGEVGYIEADDPDRGPIGLFILRMENHMQKLADKVEQLQQALDKATRK